MIVLSFRQYSFSVDDLHTADSLFFIHTVIFIPWIDRCRPATKVTLTVTVKIIRNQIRHSGCSIEVEPSGWRQVLKVSRYKY
ncbi:hypothetical protein SAMN04488057_108188 [Cyclobacterium lianum]|uniref:Uncharacterized protein n=1 Tax=Cyclobacterium lianum TaxID=388280 RepID=A0A1M7PG45_9BACT|nr:hypothetical protein SAMN04488057_108188 [Cyclobacterium lianum]